MVVVFLSGRCIRFAVGEDNGKILKLKSLGSFVDETGCILNGVITDADSFKEQMRKYWKDKNIPKKDVHLVIDTNQITAKVVEVPKMKSKQMTEFVGREFTEVERIEDPVCGYFPLQIQEKAKIVNVFASIASKGYIQTLVDTFNEIGVEISNIESARGIAIYLSEQFVFSEDSNSIIQYVDDIMLINVLIYHGKCLYSTRNRLFSDPGTPEYAVELARSVSSILQFVQAQKLEDPLTNVYVAGIEKEEFAIYEDSVQRISSSLKVNFVDFEKLITESEVIMPKDKISAYALSIGGILRKNTKNDIIHNYKKSNSSKKQKNFFSKYFLPIGILTIILSVISIALFLRYRILQAELDEVNAYNNDKNVIKTCKEYEQLKTNIDNMNLLNNSSANLKNIILSYPKVDSSVNDKIIACQKALGVTTEINGYSSETGVLSFTSTSKDEITIHKFVNKLKDEKLFSDVYYTGYNQNSDNTWSINVECILAGRKTGEDNEETSN